MLQILMIQYNLIKRMLYIQYNNNNLIYIFKKECHHNKHL